MSDPVSALQGAEFSGLVSLRDAGPLGMITLRGDLDGAAMVQALDSAMTLPVPARRQVLCSPDGARQVVWMSPDELLLILPRVQVDAALAALAAALAGTHHLAEDMSDARALITVTGPEMRLREVLAKLAPIDLQADAFRPGDIRRTRLAQVAAAVWMVDAGQINVVCFRSVARYVFDLLRHAADPAAAVDYFR